MEVGQNELCVFELLYKAAVVVGLKFGKRND